MLIVEIPLSDLLSSTMLCFFNTFSNISSTVDLGVKPMRKNPIFPLLTFRQSTTVEAAFSGDGPSQSTPSHYNINNKQLYIKKKYKYTTVKGNNHK